MTALSVFHTDIKNILEQARTKARSAVNAAMVEAYWLIGQRIVQEELQGQHKAQYGTRLMQELSTALTADFGKGFSYANLYNFRQFYRVFPDRQILYTLCRELSWSQEPKTGPRKKLESVFDFACGSGSLLLNIRQRVKLAGGSIGKIYGQEYNITTYNLARMNMLLHGVKDTEFDIYHGDTLANAWDFLRETNPAKRPQFDAVVANPPFSYRWDPSDAISEDMRFKNHGVAPKSAADFAFLLHGLHYLKDDGVMAIILPHGVLFRGGAEERIRRKLLQDGHIDTVIGLPANLFYSTGIPVCILVLKKCKKPDDVLFINAAEHFDKGKRQNQVTQEHINKIVDTYQYRKEETRYARRVGMEEIEKNDFNLNISRYVSTSVAEEAVDLNAMHQQLVHIEKDIATAKDKHNGFLKELGLKLLP